jgi:putative ABC transport system ATP-binding protein
VSDLVSGQGVSKAYGQGSGRVLAVQDVTVSLPAGSMTAVVGPSGSGKSTLLHCLSGVARPDAGSVIFDGQDLTQLTDDERSAVRRKRMSFVFQRGNLAPALTVLENAGLGLVLQGRSRQEVEDGTRDALERAGLADKAKAYPAELSGGQQQRAALARALATSPAVLWADEPTGALDRAAAKDMLRLLQDAAQAGCAVAVVSHDAEVASLAQQVIRLQDGRRVE